MAGAGGKGRAAPEIPNSYSGAEIVRRNKSARSCLPSRVYASMAHRRISHREASPTFGDECRPLARGRA